MLDIKLIRENPEIVEKNLKKRENEEKIKLLEDLIEDDKRYRQLLKEVEDLKHKRNVISKEISELKKKGEDASEEDKIKEAFYRGVWMTLFLIANNHEPGFLEKESEAIRDFHEKMKEREN